MRIYIITVTKFNSLSHWFNLFGEFIMKFVKVVEDSKFVLNRRTYIEAERYIAASDNTSFLITKSLVNDILKLSKI